MSLSLNVLRTGREYMLTNFGERTAFVVIEMFPQDDFLIQDINTLEYYHLQDLLAFGKGKDYKIEEL